MSILVALAQFDGLIGNFLSLLLQCTLGFPFHFQVFFWLYQCLAVSIVESVLSCQPWRIAGDESAADQLSPTTQKQSQLQHLLTPNHSCPGICLHELPAVNLAWVCRDSITPPGKQPVHFTRKPAVLQRVYNQRLLPLRKVTFSGIQGLFFDYAGSGVNGSHRVLMGQR